MQNNSVPIEPWYRQGWPWALIAIPATSVVLGFVMLYLALNTNNSMVVDDYYKQGKGINLRIERDRLAAQLGLGAEVHRAPDGLLLSLTQQEGNLNDTLSATQGRVTFSAPKQLSASLVHSTQADKDVELTFSSISDGLYVSPIYQFSSEGRWRLHLHPKVDANNAADGAKADWRLVSEAKIYAAGDYFTIGADDFLGHEVVTKP